MGMQEYETAARLGEEYPSLSSFVGPRDPSLVAAAEEALGVTFPPTYRRFLEELGAGNFGSFEVFGVIDADWEDSSVPDAIWYTLSERDESDLRESLVVVGEVGDGSLYCLDTSRDGDEGPVVVCEPGADEQPDETAAPDFGTFLLEGVQRVVDEQG